MKTTLKTVVLAIMVIATTQIMYAQSSFGTGTIVPAPAGTSFYLWDNNKAFVPNQVSLTSTTDATTVLTPPNGGFVFNTATAGTAPNNVTPGYYYNSGTPASPVWVRCVAVGSQGTSGQVLTSQGLGLNPTWSGLGQNSTTVYGSAGLSVPSTMTTFTLVPGLTQTLTIPANSIVYISTDGGVSTTSVASNGYSGVDIAIYIDGAILSNGGYKRIYVLNNGGLVGNFGFWSMSLAQSLSAGSHTIAVRAAYIAGSTATVSGNNLSVLQGELTVTILKL